MTRKYKMISLRIDAEMLANMDMYLLLVKRDKRYKIKERSEFIRAAIAFRLKAALKSQKSKAPWPMLCDQCGLATGEARARYYWRDLDNVFHCRCITCPDGELIV